jgi:hypothetical protein
VTFSAFLIWPGFSSRIIAVYFWFGDDSRAIAGLFCGVGTCVLKSEAAIILFRVFLVEPWPLLHKLASIHWAVSSPAQIWP